MRYRLGPWTPQGDSTQIGVPFKVVNAQPTVRGSYREIGAFVSKAASIASSSQQVLDAISVENFNNGLVAGTSARTFIRVRDTSVRIYEYRWTLDTYTNVTRAAPYTNFAHFMSSATRSSRANNGVIYAVSKQDKLQYSSGIGSAFVDLDVTAPSADVVLYNLDTLLAFNGPTWYSSATGNEINWTPSIATGAGTGLVGATTGAVLSAKNMSGGEVVVYKYGTIYRGVNVGPPILWQWSLVTDQIGINGAKSVVEVGNINYFLSRDKFYVYDGSFPREIPAFAAIRNYVLFETALRDGSGNYKTIVPYSSSLIYDEASDSIWIMLNVSVDSSFVPDALYFYIYHIPTNTFGVGLYASIHPVFTSQQFMFEFSSDLDKTSALVNSQRGVAYVEDNATASTTKLFTQYYTTGTSGTVGAAEFQFGPYGAEDLISHLNRLRLIMYRVTGNVTVTLFGSDKFHGTFTQYYTKTVDSATALLKFDAVVAGCSKRYHKITVNFSGEFEFDGFDLNMKTDSKE